MDRATRGTWATLAVVVLTAAPAHAGVEVREEAARTGTYGLRAEVVEPCRGEERLVVSGRLEGEERAEACREVMLEGEVAPGGRLVAVGGERVVLGDGFSVEAGGELVVGVTGEWSPSYVVDETPSGDTALRVTWHGRFDGVALAAGETVAVLRLVGSEEPRAWVRYEPGSGGGWLWAEVLEGDGALRGTERGWMPDGWHRVELTWDSGAAISSSGRLELLVDGASVGLLEDLALGSVLIEAVDLGAMEAPGSGGWVDADDYEVLR